ncbi:hypothetical protein QC762_512340 [Podospora pseudocomata]|uniref:Uncharacterized protein n=1 Tax=Podospora pseudocomata TaxID=2093779 RepID=A0ABR0GC40_9PEZI|nr:hypothetical protein QC762_512340 [Podospora pseudocomata]
MKSILLLLSSISLAASACAQGKDYFFHYVAGNSVINGQRLRGNFSIPYVSPGVSHAPYNPSDHFNRIHLNTSLTSTAPKVLLVVPTNPHPPPVPGYYGLSNAEGFDSAYRLVYSYRPEEAGNGFVYRNWRTNGNLLRFDIGGASDDGYRWIAVWEVTQAGNERWVPWWVKPTVANFATLEGWEYDIAELELVEATGPVNSLAPGGVQE